MKIQLLNSADIAVHNYKYITNPLRPIFYFTGTDKPDTFQKLNQESDSIEPSIDLAAARKISGIHCPVCGIKMLSRNEHRKFIENAVNIKDTKQLVEILNKNEEFIPVKLKKVLYDTKRLPDYKSLSVPEYVIALRDIAYKDKVKAANNVREYLIAYPQENNVSDEHRQVILKLADSLNGDTHYRRYKKHLLMLGDENLLSMRDLNAIKKDTMRDFLFADMYYDGLNIKNLDDMSQDEVLRAFIDNIFVRSRNHLHKIEKYDNHLNNPNNVILLCGDCELRRGKNTFYNDRFQPDLKQNIKAYLRDIAFLNGSKVISIPTDYLTYVCYRSNTLSKGILVFEPSEIKYVTSPQNIRLRHEKFSPIIQTKVDIPCAECGSTMLPHQIKTKISSELDKCRNPYDYAEILKKYDKYIGYYAQDIAMMFVDTAESKSFISEDEFLDTFYRRVKGYLRVGRNNSLQNYKQAREYYHKNAPEKVRTYEKVYKEVKKYIAQGKFDDYDIGKLVNDCLKPTNYNEYNIKSISTLLRDFAILNYKYQMVYPIGRDIKTKNDYIRNIAYNLFASDTATADHLIAYNQGGEGSRYNLIGLCKACNKLKSDKSVIAWYDQHTMVKRNLPKQLEVIDEMARYGELDGYDDWASGIAKTMYDETKGKCDIRDMFREE